MSKKKFAHAFALLALLVIATAHVIFAGLLGFFKGADAEEEYETEVIPVDTVDYDHIMLGDLNGDNEINNADLILMRRYHAGSTVTGMSVTGLVAADVNEDNGINNADLIMVRRHLANSDAGIIEGYHSHNWTTKKIHHDEVGHYENEYKDWKEYNYYPTSYLCSNSFSVVPEFNTYYGPSKYLNMFNNNPTSTWFVYIFKHFNNGSVYDISKLLYSEKEDRGYTINGTHVAVYTGNVINYYTIDTSKCKDISYKIASMTNSNWDVDSNKEFETQYKYSLYETIEHHDLVGQTWVVDTAAYDETIYTCSVCGATK